MERFPIILICLVAGEAMQFGQSLIQATNVHPLIGLFGGVSALLQVVALYYIYQIIAHLKDEAQATQPNSESGD